MKFFISHSHEDSYFAESIRKDLEDIGATVFLDNHTVQFGDKLSEANGLSLSEADEVIIIISQASLHSQWIPYEIGVAEHAGKRIVPILYGIEKNEVPEILRDRSRLSINQMTAYLDQVRQRMGQSATNTTKEPAQTITPPKEEAPELAHAFEIGTQVRLPQSRPTAAKRNGENIGWTQGMDSFLNRTAQVIEVAEDNSVRLSLDKGRYWFATEWLEVI